LVTTYTHILDLLIWNLSGMWSTLLNVSGLKMATPTDELLSIRQRFELAYWIRGWWCSYFDIIYNLCEHICISPENFKWRWTVPSNYVFFQLIIGWMALTYIFNTPVWLILLQYVFVVYVLSPSKLFLVLHQILLYHKDCNSKDINFSLATVKVSPAVNCRLSVFLVFKKVHLS